MSVPEPAAEPPRPATEHTRDRVPLAALHARIHPVNAGIHWSLDPDGAPGRGLVQPGATVYAVPLRLEHPVQLQGRVRLLPHDWRDGTRAVRARALVRTGADPTPGEIWSASIRSASARGEAEGVIVECVVPADATELQMIIDRPAIRDAGSVARAAWIEPEIIDPVAAPDPPRQGAHLPAAAPEAPHDARTPLFSVLTPVHDPPLDMLREAIESVRAQTFPSWELCLIDDGSRDPLVIEELRRYAESDPRIRLTRRQHAGGISDATNAALALAGGRFVVLLDHDDLLTPNALELVERTLAADPELDMVYSDEAVYADGRRVTQIIKPGWAPDSLTCHMYTGHLSVCRRTLALEVGGFRTEFDGCQDYDYVLRVSTRTDRIAHIPAQLYLWRAHLASTAGGVGAKPYAYLAQPRAIGEHLRQVGIAADIRFGAAPGMHRIVHRIDPELSISVVLATDRATEVADVAKSLVDQPHPAWDLTVVAPPATHETLRAAIDAVGLNAGRARLVAAAPDQADTALALAGEKVMGEHVMVMQWATGALTDDWMTALLGYSAQRGIGAAGPTVIDRDGRIVESGWVFPEGIALPLSGGLEAESASSVALNVSAVSGVLVTPRALLCELGGLDPSFGQMMLAEYSTRVIDSGRRVVNVPDSRLFRHAPAPPVNDLPALWRLRLRWLADHDGDPLYNPNLRTDRADQTPWVPL